MKTILLLIALVTGAAIAADISPPATKPEVKKDVSLYSPVEVGTLSHDGKVTIKKGADVKPLIENMIGEITGLRAQLQRCQNEKGQKIDKE